MIEIVGLLLDAIDLSHLEALPGPSCVSTALQLKRKRSLWARFAEANENYHNISNTWLVRGFPSSSPLTPATQSVSRKYAAGRKSTSPRKRSGIMMDTRILASRCLVERIADIAADIVEREGG
jgi:hypothetical protein